MSKCISQNGEYSEHAMPESGPAGERFICTRCYVLDEDAALAEVDRLTEALEAAQSVAQRDEAEKGRLWQHLRDRCERAEADLADEKRRHGELRAGVEALAARAEKFAYMEPSGMGLANELRALLTDATTEPQQTPRVGTEGRGML